MTHIYIICKQPHALFPKGLCCSLESSGTYRVTPVSLQTFSDVELHESIVPLFIWDKEVHTAVLQSIGKMNGLPNPVLIIAESALNKNVLKQLITCAGRRGMGFVGHDCSFEELDQYIFALHEGRQQWAMSSGIMQMLLTELAGGTRIPRPLKSVAGHGLLGLSAKEQQILALAGEGHSIRQTAEVLQLSHNTIAAYRSKMLRKAGVHSITELLERYKDSG